MSIPQVGLNLAIGAASGATLGGIVDKVSNKKYYNSVMMAIHGVALAAIFTYAGTFWSVVAVSNFAFGNAVIMGLENEFKATPFSMRQALAARTALSTCFLWQPALMYSFSLA